MGYTARYTLILKMYSLFIWNSNVTGDSAFHLATLFLCQVHFLLIWPILNPIRLWGLGKALGNGGFKKKLSQARSTLVLLEFQAYLELCLYCMPWDKNYCVSTNVQAGFFFPRNIMKIKMLWMNWKGVLFKGRLPGACKFLPHQLRHSYDFVLSLFLLTI